MKVRTFCTSIKLLRQSPSNCPLRSLAYCPLQAVERLTRMFPVYFVRVASTLSTIGYPFVQLYTSPGWLYGLLLHQRLTGAKCRPAAQE